MNNEQAIKVLLDEWKCIDRNDGINCDRQCEKCDLVMDSAILKDAYNMAIKALEQEMKRDKDCEWGRMTFESASGILQFDFSDGTVKRVKQAELEHIEDAISREAVDKRLVELLSGDLYNEEMRDKIVKLRLYLFDLPSVNVKPIECDDAISREAVLEGIEELKRSPWATANRSHGYEYLITEALDVVKDLCVKQLPSVTQKSGKCKNCKYFEYDSVAKVDGIPLIVAHEICKRWGDGCKTSEDGYCYLFEPQEVR